MENNISQIHDKMFKETFGNLVVAGDFLKAYLPEAIRKYIDLDTLEPQKGSFVTQEYRELFTDLLYKAKIYGQDGYICILFEHKSYSDKYAIYQILKYIIEIWASPEQEEGEKSPPLVIPLLIYNGKTRWNHETSIQERMQWFNDLPGELKELVPVYRHLMVDLSEIDLDIKTATALQLLLRVIRDARQLDRDGMIATIREIMVAYTLKHEDDKVTYYVRVCLRYVFGVKSEFTREDLLSIANQVSRKGSELIMTLAEQLRQEGRLEGKLEGKLEGRLETTTEIIKNALAMSMKAEDIIKLTGLTMEELDKIKNEMPQ